MKTPVYLDYAATTPVDPRVATKMFECLTLDGNFANPASKSHKYGWFAAEAVDIARNQIADLIGADSREIVFTSGATESDNIATIGVANALKDSTRKKIITSSIEHKAVLDPCAYLAKKGYDVVYLKPNAEGEITVDELSRHLDENTLLVSIMHANNEIGVVNDIEALAKLSKSKGALFHTDCAQSAGKLPINTKKIEADYISLCAHKVYGPKGIGALYVRSGSTIPEAMIHGGGHERGMRSGTLATHQIVGMGEAFEIAKKEMKKESVRLIELRNKFANALLEIEGVTLNGSLDQRLPNNLNLSFAGINGEAFIMGLRDIAVSMGSACTSASLLPSYVLKELGLSDELAHSSIRFSFGRFTTEEEIDFAIELVKNEYLKQKQMGDLWN
jgi:cysteine desulfurase